MEQPVTVGVGDASEASDQYWQKLPSKLEPISGFQHSVWKNGLGDEWLRRNKDDLGLADLVLPAIEKVSEKPTAVLEIGCSTGWRLKRLRDRYGCRVIGIDPSKEALEIARKDDLEVYEGMADQLPFINNSFDYVIFGHCLCFISPEEWTLVVHESSRVLVDGGYLIIDDTASSGYTKRLLQWINTTEDRDHKYPAYLFYYPWKTLWLAHPMYKLVSEDFDMNNANTVVILKKGLASLLRGE